MKLSYEHYYVIFFRDSIYKIYQKVHDFLFYDNVKCKKHKILGTCL